jgi:Mce-associated membrane protein
MMSTAGVKSTLPDLTTETPEPDENGSDESLEAIACGPAVAADDASPDSDDSTHSDDADVTPGAADDGTGQARSWRSRLGRIVAYGMLPVAALLLAAAAGYLKWVGSSARDADVARAQSVQAAVDSTVAMLSYRPDTVEKNLAAARDRMTGAFRDSYTSLTNDVVIPGAKQRQISAVATVPAAASASATETHAVVLVFVNQSTIIGNDPPTDTASTVKVTLEKVHDRWLISQFDPV